MAIKINGQDLLKRYINGQEIVRVYKNGGQIRPETVPPVGGDYLCFTAEESNSSVTLWIDQYIPTPVEIEISYNKTTWMDYNIGGVIALSNIGDKVYMRNKSETPTGFSRYYGWYRFSMVGKIGASGDVGYLLCKYSTDTLTDRCFTHLFYECDSLVSAPSLPATTLSSRCYEMMFRGTSIEIPPSLPATTLGEMCYYQMFRGCKNLIALPLLRAINLPAQCYSGMFYNCTKIKVSLFNIGEYQTAYRIPVSGTGTAGNLATADMFYGTGGFTGDPAINTTYYTSNQVI